MAAVINPRPSSSSHSSMGEAKPALLHRIEGQVARVNAVFLLAKEEGVVTISDDRSVRIWLKRDNGQFWPSIHHFMPFAPSAMHFIEDKPRMLVGLVSGAVYEYVVAEDMNSISQIRHWNAHTSTVTAVLFSQEAELVFSCSKDKSLVWHCTETSVRMGVYMCESSCTALQFDSLSKFVFVGDSGGNIILLRLSGSEAQFVSKLSAHTASVTSLAWDSSRQLLFSGASDHLVIMWDIGGKKGQAFELNAHSSKLSSLAYANGACRLFSADDNGTLVCWDMTAKRLETPEWKTSDTCQLCDSPFFWNIRAMWDRKVVGLRQHHCRTCGNAVCGGCCEKTTRYPPMGYELPVRICNACNTRMQTFPEQFDLTPLSVISELRQGVTCMHLQESIGRLVTVGTDRVIMIWDVKQLV